MRPLGLALFVLGCLVLPLQADDSAIYGVGGSVELLKPEHSTIRMVRERVDVVMRSHDSPEVRCEFLFKNEGKATTVKMGFPDRCGGDVTLSSSLRDFRSWVDGKPVKTRIEGSKSRNEDGYSGWRVKNVHFGAGQSRTIVDTYRGGLGASSDGSSFFEYVLKTGASWKGQIGSAVIRVDTRPMLRVFRLGDIKPTGSKVSGGIVTWRLTNLEPTEDISIIFKPRVTGVPVYDRVNGRLVVRAHDLAELLHITSEVSRGVCTMTTSLHTLKLRSRSRTAILDGKKSVRLPTTPYIVRGYLGKPDLVVPIAAVVKALGGSATLSGDKLGMTFKR